MSKTPTYKAVAEETSHGENYNVGRAVVFGNSIKEVIAEAKEKAFDALRDEEIAAEDPGTSVLAVITVFKGSKEVFWQSY